MKNLILSNDIYIMIDNLLTYHVSSKDRDSGISSDFIIDLNIDQGLKEVLTHCVVQSLVVPKSYYNIQENSNLLLYEGNQEINIYVEPGNYTRQELIKTLQTKFNAQTLNNITYTISKNTTLYEDGKLKITCDKPEITKKLIFSNNELYECMGFNMTEYIFTNEIISPNVQNMNSNNIIYLHSNIVSSNNNDFQTSGNNILCYLNNCGSCQSFSYIEKDFDLIYNMKKLLFNSAMRFYLTSENRELNLNGLDINFTISFFRYTENIQYYRKFSNYIDYKLISNN